MSGTVPWIGAQADNFEDVPNFELLKRKREKRRLESRAAEFSPSFSGVGLPKHQFPAAATGEETQLHEADEEIPAHEFQMDADRREEERRARELQRQNELDREEELRPYRGRTVKLLRRYMRMAIETGRLPSVLGSAFFRTGVTCYSAVTFEDRAIFVHDMEICLEQLDEFARQIIGRYVLQGHSLPEAARLLHCDEKTIRRNVSMVLDDCSEILLKKGLLERLESNREKSCQGGKSDENFASDC